MYKLPLFFEFCKMRKSKHSHSYTPSSMKIGELSHRIFSFIKAKFSSIAALRFKILTKIKGKRHGSKFGFHIGWSICESFYHEANKFGVANLKFKNCIQKGAIALVATMLLAIPNIRLCSSSVGNYQTSSMAIKANNIIQFSNNNRTEKCVYLPLVALVAIAGVVLAGLAALGAVSAFLASDDVNGNDSKYYIIFNTINGNKNYEKYDFSQFDN